MIAGRSEILAPQLSAALCRTPGALRDPRRYPTARLTREQRESIDADPGLTRLFFALDVLGPKGAPGSSMAARLAGVSRTTLWRRFRAIFGHGYFHFVREMRVDALDLLYQVGRSTLRLEVAAERSGLGNAARARAAFIALRRPLP